MCIIYAHGGGCVNGTASQNANHVSYRALDFNVDNRLALEYRFGTDITLILDFLT